MAIIPRTLVMEELTAFCSLPLELIRINVIQSEKIFEADFEDANPTSEEELINWYAETPCVIFSLANINTLDEYVEITSLARCYNHGKQNVKILDYRCGIGGLIYYMRKDTSSDNKLWGYGYPSKTFEYAKFLNRDNNINFAVNLDDVPNDLDCITNINIFKYPPFTETVLDMLLKKLKPGGCLITHINEITSFVPDYLIKHGFEREQERAGSEKWVKKKK